MVRICIFIGYDGRWDECNNYVDCKTQIHFVEPTITYSDLVEEIFQILSLSKNVLGTTIWFDTKIKRSKGMILRNDRDVEHCLLLVKSDAEFKKSLFIVDFDRGVESGQVAPETHSTSVNSLSLKTPKVAVHHATNDEIVHFRALERPKEDDFSLELAKNHTYDDVVERVAQRLRLDDPSKIRLTSHNCYYQKPKPNPIKYRSVEKLMEMLVHYNQVSDILYYEVLDIPLPELECLKTLKVTFSPAKKDEVAIHNVRLPKQSTVRDVLSEIKSKVELSHPNAELRLLEIFYHKIHKIFNLNEKIEYISDQYWTLQAEEIPEEEKNLGPHDRLIHVYHFTKDIGQNQTHILHFGDPFLLVIHEAETLADVKVRIQKKLQVPHEEFSEWKFAFVSLGRPVYLEDSVIVSSRFQRRDVYARWVQYLGLEHSDSGRKRARIKSEPS